MTWALPLLQSDSSVSSTESQASSNSSSVSPTDLLEYFSGPHVPLPPSARVGDPKLKQRESQKWGLWQLWKAGTFAAAKATGITMDIISHYVKGPRRKTWGIEMTLLSSIMRDVGQHSYLADLVTIRMLMGIGGLVPLPSDALVTPVTFRVHKRKLRGILENFDAAEDGTRELSGEWVVGKKTWQRLQNEWRAAKVAKQKPSQSQPSMQIPKKQERVILYLHGGAYYLFSAATHRLITIPLCKYLDARLFAVDYRLAPETRFPGPLHDAVSSYFRLVDELHIPAENIIVAGDSAGGGLALALLMYLRDNDYPLPSSAILMSPWVDLTLSCDSWDSNAPYDIVPLPLPGDHLNPIACYLGEHMEKYLTHPYASPLFGDFTGLPPLLIQAGDAEVLRDEITLLAHKATIAGVEVQHELYEDCVHVFQTLPFMEASKHAFMSCREFVRTFLPERQMRSPQTLDEPAESRLAKEIDNDDTRVVRGDGSDSTVNRKQFQSDSEQDASLFKAQTQEEPSWGEPSLSLPTPPMSSDEDDTRRTRSDVQGRSPHDAHHPHKSRLPRTPSLQQLRSTLSVIADASSVSHRSRSRAYSQHEPSQPDQDGDSPPSSLGHRYTSFGTTLSSKTIPPRPSIRRSRYSHPDISSLCEQWAIQGPANRTVMM